MFATVESFERARRRRESKARMAHEVASIEADIRIEAQMFEGRRIPQLRERLARAKERLAVADAQDKGKEIHDWHQQETADVARQLRESQDERYPREYRDRQREELTREYRRIDQLAAQRMKAWYDEQLAEAQRIYETPEQADAATETRLLREEMEAASLAQRYAGRTMAKNHLIPEARRLLRLGLLDRARVHVEAARRAGAEDGSVERELSAALDRSLPHRQRAIKQRIAVITEYERFRIDELKGRVINGIGTSQQQARDSSVAKFAEWKQQREDQMLAAADGRQPEEESLPRRDHRD